MLLQQIILIIIPLVTCYRHQISNLRPIIGILAQESDPGDKHLGDMYIPATYIKFVEMGGARAVPVMVKQTPEYLTHMFNSINGILFPGGDVNISHSEFSTAAVTLYEMALTANKAGDFFPVWGTCQGFQLLTYLTSNRDLLSKFNAQDLALPLNFTQGSKNSRLFKDLPDDLYKIISTENVTENFHNFGVSPQVFHSTPELNNFYNVLSTNVDKNGRTFVSTIEGVDYPIYGVQWHPEKPNFTWDTELHINHGADAIRVAQYIANFLVSEARKSSHQFSSMEEEVAALIDNYIPHYSSDSTFTINYYFNYTHTTPSCM